MTRKRLVTVEEAILLHLLDYSRYEIDDTVPIELAQAGISRALGIRRSHVSMSLDSAKKRELIREHLARVKGQGRRRKCYFLTGQGRELAGTLRENIGQIMISARLPDGTDFKGPLSELASMVDGFNLPRIALLAADGIVKLPAAEPEMSRDMRIPEFRNFVGREHELTRLKEFFDGTARILLMSGMPGIGKTALAAKAASGHDVFWFEINEWAGPRNMANHLAQYLAGRGAFRMKRYLEAREMPDIGDLKDILLDIDFPLTMIFDDCQNAGGSMTGLLKMLASACGNSRHLKAGFLARDMPDILEIRQILTDQQIIRIMLSPLGETESVQLLLNRGIGGADAERISSVAGGHPLYLTLASADEESVGQSIENMLARMIYQNLSDRENRILHQLAVYRLPVDSDALVEDSEDIAVLEKLENKCMVLRSGGWGMHNLIKTFYYSRQSPSEREARHERAAEFYNTRFTGPEGQIEEVFHLLKARDFESGILSLAGRGEAWLSQGFVDEILNLTALVPDDWNEPEGEYEVHYLTAAALDLVGDWDGASEHYGICLELARQLDDADRETAILRREGAILYRRGELEDAGKIFEESLELLGESANPQLLASIHGSLGVVYWRTGDAKKARKSHEHDLEISTGLKEKSGIARALNNLGILDWQSGDYGTALERYSRALKLAEKLDDKKLVAILYSNIGDVHRSRGEMVEARRYYERCLELAEYLKFNWQVAEAYRGLAQIVLDDAGSAESRNKYLQKALAIFQRLGAEEDVKSVMELMRNP